MKQALHFKKLNDFKQKQKRASHRITLLLTRGLSYLGCIIEKGNLMAGNRRPHGQLFILTPRNQIKRLHLFHLL